MVYGGSFFLFQYEGSDRPWSGRTSVSLKDGRFVDGHFAFDNDRLGISYVISS